jgi:CRP/FNR family transcriptional regulator, cyclic AMP receptor protein
LLGAEQLEASESFSGTTLHIRSASAELVKEIQRLADIKLSGQHPRGAMLFSEGQEARGVYLLQAGRVKVSISSATGKVLILRIVQASDLLGVNSALKGSKYDATVQTLEACRTDFIPRTDFIKLLDQNKRARIGVYNALSRELTEVVEHARLLLLPSSTMEKLAKLLVKWCDERDGAEPDGIRVNPGVTQQEIAQMICASRETVTRLFAELKRKQLVSLADNAIIIRNRKALESLACY